MYAYVKGNPISLTDPFGLCPPETPTYLQRVVNNYTVTVNFLNPTWTKIPGLNPLTRVAGASVAPLVGGLTWGQAFAYAGTDLAANAYLAASITTVATGIILKGSLDTGVLIGSLLSPNVIAPSFNNENSGDCGCK